MKVANLPCIIIKLHLTPKLILIMQMCIDDFWLRITCSFISTSSCRDLCYTLYTVYAGRFICRAAPALQEGVCWMLGCPPVCRRKTIPHRTTKGERLCFAERYTGETQEFWRSVIFTDKTNFSSIPRSTRHCRRPIGERYHENFIFHSDRLGRVSQAMYGWMWFGGVGEIIPAEGTLTSLQYINILETCLLPSVRMCAIDEPLPIILVQDRSPIHTSRAVTTWFANHQEFQLLDWPPKGCDINPIENLWGIMKSEWEVQEKTKASIIQKSTETWESLRRTPDICEKARRLHPFTFAAGDRCWLWLD